MSGQYPKQNTSPSTTPPTEQSSTSIPDPYLSKLPVLSNPIEISSTDVIKIIQQYLFEQGLHRSLKTLQEESNVSTNTVPNVDTFVNDITNGNWERVLDALTSFSLPHSKLVSLYEQIILELAEVQEFETASLVLQTTPVLQYMSKEFPERYTRLHQIILNHESDKSELYGKTKKLQRRLTIAAALKREAVHAPPSRLLHLLTNGLRWQQHIGLLPQDTIDYDLFTDTMSSTSTEAERPITKLFKIIPIGANDYCNVVKFTPNGKHLVTGSSDGLIELRDVNNGHLATDLEYQRNEKYLSHLSAITSIAFSVEGDLMATASMDGDIKVWNIYSGECISHLRDAHNATISHLAFSPNAKSLLSTSLDGTIKMWGLQNNSQLYSYSTSVIANIISSSESSTDDSNSMAATSAGSAGSAGGNVGVTYAGFNSSDHVIIIDNDGNGAIFHESDCILAKNFTDGLGVYNVSTIPLRPDVLCIALRGSSKIIVISDKTLSTLQSYSLDSSQSQHKILSGTSSTHSSSSTPATHQQPPDSFHDLTHVTTSALAKYLYGVGIDSVVYVFNFDTKKLVHGVKAHVSQIKSICHHPFRNILVTASLDGTVKIWK